jgi:ABC-type uncharacterized transport system auxiliary subunit
MMRNEQNNLRELFKQTDAILREQMDRLVVTFKATHPDFVKTYESTRIIVDPPKKSVQFKEIVTDKIIT